MARFQIHDTARVSELTDSQVTGLTSFLSSPSNVVDPMNKRANNPLLIGSAGVGAEGRMHLAPANFVWRGDDGRSPRASPNIGLGVSQSEMLKRLKESDGARASKIQPWLESLPHYHPRSPKNPKNLQRPEGNADPLAGVLVENEAKRLLRENIAHHRTIGTYRGRRHAMGLPVRGQRTNTNAMTARRLNRIERRG
ncbi:hypothetical protein FRB99_008106 [Tulasnella sp. 403]|nr:hypothetical protein FRB99_008106 [Tulasnella sp. 403]